MDLSEVKGIGEKVAKRYKRLGIASVEGLLLHLPRSYIDFSNLTKLKNVQPGELAVVGRISNVSSRYSKSRTHITEATFSDESGSVKVVWFNQPFRARSIKTDKEYLLMGSLDFAYGKYQVINPDIEEYKSQKQARIIANYPLTKGLSSKMIRRHINAVFKQGLDQNIEALPDSVKNHVDMDLHQALKLIHMPDNIRQVEQAKKVLEFWELFALTLASEQLRQQVNQQNTLKVEFKESVTKDFVKSLNFKLTDDQRKAAWQILKDMDNKNCNRLLNGDVGSGKTIVALIAALNTIKNGYQVAFIAPTTVLAKQHYQEVKKYFDNVGLITSELSSGQKKQIINKLKEGKLNFVVGTHALFEESVKFKNLSLVILDEQHRFGVEQRKSLLKDNQTLPHVLSMSATPIPRSLALTLYGELDVSKIKSKPLGRKEIDTKLISSNARQEAFDEIRRQIKQNHQVYVVCPLIEKSEALDALSIEEAHNIYSKKFKDLKVELLHGKMKPEQKNQILSDFDNKKIDILISTTVIEVGVDVANANLMVIENAERFGLAQLHQLRGRVGRSSVQATCYLLSGIYPPPKRLRVMVNTNDGFKLAELDLKLRGPGAIYGKSQHGQLDLRIASLNNIEKIEQAKQAAKVFSESSEKLIQYPQLKKRVNNFKAINYLN